MSSPLASPGSISSPVDASTPSSQAPRRLPPPAAPLETLPDPPKVAPSQPYFNTPSIIAYPDLPPPTASQQSAIDTLSKLLGRPLQITIRDGRTYIGYLAMIDHDQNFLLSQAEEFQPFTQIHFSPNDTDAEYAEKEAAMMKEDEVRLNRDMYWPRSEPSRADGWGGREVGLTLVKGSDIVKVEMEESWPSEATGDEKAQESG